MIKLNILLKIIALTLLLVSCSEADTTAPNVVKTFPKNGSTNVDPSLTKISVTFDEPMKDGNWSWAYAHKGSFPEMTAQPYYKPGYVENILPVILIPNKEYEIWINSEKFKNFTDRAGNPSAPFRLIFKTK